MKNVNELKAGAMISYLNLGISFIIPLIYTPIMLRILGQAEYGLYSLSQSVISYLSLLTLGLSSALLRYMMKYRTNGDKIMLERVIGLFVIIYSIIAIVVCIIGTGITFFSEQFFSSGLTEQEIEKLNLLIIILSFSTAISFLSSVFSGVVICYERYIFKRLFATITTIASPILNLIVLYSGYASVGMAIVSVIAQVVTLVIYIWYCEVRLDVHPILKNPPKELLRDIFSFTVFVFVGMIADLLYWATDKVLIGAMIGSTAVAVYNVGSTFNSMLQNIAGAISGVFAPRVNTYVFEKRSISELSQLMIRVGRIQYLLVALILSGFCVFGQSFLYLWAGDGYEEAYQVALFTMFPLAVPLIQNIAFTTICAQNRHQFRSILYAVLAVANVAGTYCLIPTLGIKGAALCTCVVFVVGHGFLMNWFYYKKIGLAIPLFWKNIIKMSIVPSVMTLVTVVLQRYVLDFTSPMLFVGGVIIYTCIYCLLSWNFSMNEYEKSLFLGCVGKLKNKGV